LPFTLFGFRGGFFIQGYQRFGNGDSQAIFGTKGGLLFFAGCGIASQSFRSSNVLAEVVSWATFGSWFFLGD
jgi:hypothetical protein